MYLCVLICFIKPILGNRCVRSRGFIVSEPVCVALFYYTDIEESLCTVPGLHRERVKGDAPTIRDRRRPYLTLSPFR